MRSRNGELKWPEKEVLDRRHIPLTDRGKGAGERRAGFAGWRRSKEKTFRQDLHDLQDGEMEEKRFWTGLTGFP
jgi:hypothetical protein